MLIFGALFLFLTVTPLVISLDQDNGIPCSGWGGTITWYTHESPTWHSQLRLRRSQGMNEESDLVERTLVTPCDALAVRQVKVSLGYGVVVLLLGLFAVWLLGRWPKATDHHESESPNAGPPAWGPMPPSPPEAWPDGSPPNMHQPS